MDETLKKLEKFALDELKQELRVREAGRRKDLPNWTNQAALLATAADSPENEELADVDTATIVSFVQDKQKAIYGVDDRMDLFEINDAAILAAADSVVALFKSSEINDNGDGTSTLVTRSFASRFNLCANERYRNQPVGAFCTGFLVAPNLIATAGHCVNGQNVRSRRFVFGFRMNNSTQAQTVIPNSEIYSGKSLVGRKLDGSGSDWAIVELDRAVTNHRPLPIRRTGRISSNRAVYVIGHPSGLPAKFAPGANVRDNSAQAFFQANLDTYGGNSGSPVFNEQNVVEGILVRGETDFVAQGNCMVSLVCPTTGCQGEDCTRTTEFASLIPAQP